MVQHSKKNDTTTVSPQKSTPGSALVGRLFWTLAGPSGFVGLFLSLPKEGGWTTVWDGLFFLSVVFMLLGRWIEIKSGAGTTLYGEPATWTHFNRYAVGLIPAAVTAWVVINLYFVR